MPYKLLRVTEIISPYVSFNNIPDETMKTAIQRGTMVHEYLRCYALSLWSPRPEGAEGYCESGERWIDTYAMKVISAEEEYRDEALGFCGHPDLLIENINRQIWLVDFKTPVTEAKTWAIQLAAYHRLVVHHHHYDPENTIPGALMLAPDGATAKLKRYDRDRDYFFGLFLGALNLKRYFSNGGL